MDADTPTHFNAIVVGTGLSESILAAALSKAGYSILQLDQEPHYGSSSASLSLSELITWASLPSSAATHSTPSPALLALSNRFALSLRPTLLLAGGEALEVLVQSKVAAYLQFGMLGGVGLWREDEGTGVIERVPGSKADVFNHPTLSLVEKRRLTKLLLFAAGEEELETSLMLSDPAGTFPAFLEKSFSVPPAIASSLAYALTLCSSPEDLALPALKRLRTFIRSMGRYGPSPFLVGHYGGAGDLVGGFSRVCAVWGGGQILGRPLHPLVLDSTPGVPVASQSPPSDVSTPVPSTSTGITRPLGIPVFLELTGPPTTFTADWVISSSSHLPTLFPSASFPTLPPTAVHAIVILSSVIPFPPPAEIEDPSSLPDSTMFVFPPRALSPSLGTLTALQLGSGTFAAPADHFVLHLSAPLLTKSTDSAETLLKPYLSSLLSLSTPAQEPLFTLFHALSPPPPPPDLPANMRVVPELGRRTDALVGATEEAVEVARGLFWEVVGVGREEGVEFFVRAEAEEEEGTM